MKSSLVGSDAAASSALSLPSWFGEMRRRTTSPVPARIERNDLAFILRNLSTLIENGVSLPKALAAISQERTLKKHAPLLEAIRRKVETGETFSGAMSAFPNTFNALMVNQVRSGERSGTLADTLARITEQQEKMNALRSLIIKKLSYPVILVVLGTAVVTFMLVFVVPIFEETYSDAGVPLPLVTQLLIAVGQAASKYYWMVLLAGVAGFLLVHRLRKNPEIAYRMDRFFLRLPLIGGWLRHVAVLQFMDVLGNLMESGFRIAEALRVSADSVGNRAVRRSVQALELAVQRGERFSRELEQHGDMFPPVVSQLVIVGEQTGNMAKATVHIREHLRREIERTTNILVGTIEPVLTIGLAAAIGVTLLAIYLPMFDMIGTMTK